MMTGPSVYHVHLDKLGHRVEEIRVRALDNIISKLNLGFVKENDYFVRKELFLKVLQWFNVNPCVEKAKALGVVLSLLKGKLGKRLILEVGVANILLVLSSIKRESDSNTNMLINEIKAVISEKETEETCTEDSVDGECNEFIEHPLHNVVNQGSHDTHSKVPGICSEQTVDSETCIWNYLHYMHLPWQPLVATDNHVLAAVEESLGSMNDPDLVLHTCNFFMDVMLQDFPAEVFLQRPTLVKIFLSNLNEIVPGTQKKVCSAMLKCLNKLTFTLLVRIHYYSDPAVLNAKQEWCTTRSQTPSYFSHVSSRATVTDEELSMEQVVSQGCDRQSEDDYICAGGDSSHITNMRSQMQNVHFGPHVSNKGKHISEVETEDTVLLKFQQMSLPLYCIQALHQAVSHRSIHLTLELIKLAKCCISPTIWASQDNTVLEIVGKIVRVLDLLGDAIKQHRRAPQTEEDARLNYLQTLAVTRRFLVSVVPLDLADIVIPRNLKYALVTSLLDYSLQYIMPQLHQDLLKYCEKFTSDQPVELLRHYRNTIDMASSMAATVNFLKNYDRLDGKKILILAEEALPSLVYHKAASFVKIVLEICSNKMGRWTLSSDVKKTITKITLCLLTHCESDIKQEMYMLCHTYVISALGVEQQSPLTEGPTQVAFLFNVSILTEILCHGVMSDDGKISKYSSEILVHFLKAQVLMSKALWQTFVEQLIPTMPLLQCFAEKSTNLGRTIIEMLCSSTGESMFIPKIEILKGNLRLLFASDEFVRSDGISRLMTFIAREEYSSEKLPNIASLQVKTLSSFLLFENAMDLTVPRKLTSFYEISSMCQVMDVLKTDSAEPRIHRSAFSQMAVMMEDPHLHSSFLELKGVDVCLSVFQKALVEHDLNYYPDSVISIVSVLKNVCFHNSNIRFTLSQDFTLYFCIIRALFMFGNNRNFRQDIGQLLCFLLYSDYLIIVPESQSEDSAVLHSLSLPEIVVKCMMLPFLPHIHWRTSPHALSSFRGTLLGHDDSRAYLRMCWTSEWFGGVKQILSWHSIKLTEQSEFSPNLRPLQSDLDCLKCTALNHCSKQCLYSIQNGTSHQSVETAVKRMLGYVTLQALLKERNEHDFQGNWKSMPWELTLLRFFGTTPACPEDEDLLISLLQFLSLCIQHLSSTEIRKPQWTWVYRILKDPSQPLPCMLKMDSTTVSKNISREILQLCQDCCLLEHQLEEDENGKGKADVVSWVYLVNIISQNLQFSDAQHFYNLAYLDWMLSCLCHITGSLGWSRGYDTVGQLMRDLIWYLAEIVTAFHCNKGGQGGTGLASFMGMSVTRNATLCMNHILCEMQNTASNRSWEAAWFTALTGSDLEGGVSLGWLPSLWLSRDPIIRASSLQLVAGLCSTQLGTRFLIQGLRESPPDVWEVALSFVLDHEEACIIREQAAIVLANLSNHGIPNNATSSVSPDTNSPGETPTVLNIYTFLSLLEDKRFFHGVIEMLSGLHMATSVKPGLWTLTNTGTAGSSSGTGLSRDTDLQPLTASQEDITQCFFTTPNLIKAVCWYLNNLLTVSPEEIVKNVIRYGLLKILFRTISGIPEGLRTRMETIQYTELVEMYIAVCTVLAKCVCINSDCLSIVLNMSECLKNVLALLDPTLYSSHRADLLHLRNRLWSRVFRLLSCFLTDVMGYDAIMSCIFQNNPLAFLATIENSINGKSSTDLRSNALSTLTLLLSLETKTSSFQSVYLGLHEENDSSYSRNNLLQNVLDQSCTKNKDLNFQSISGAHLCGLLMHLYEIQSLRHSSGDNKIPSYFPKAAVMGALSCLLAVSRDAKKFALKEGLLENVMVQLKELHVHISVEAVDSLRKLSERKRVSAVFQDVSSLFTLLTNFLYNASDVKVAAVSAGLSDAIHKLWAWCYILPSLLGDTLKLLCTFTTNSVQACQSMVLTTSILGVQTRRAPSSNSLLHEVVNLILREMELLSKGGDTNVLALAFHLLQNATHSQECRIALFKSTLFQSFSKFYPSCNKRQKSWEVVEMLWLPFLIDCTFHIEGQLGFPKVQEALDVILLLIDNSKPIIQQSALIILRNITFHHLNRPRLLSSSGYLQLLNKKLNDGSEEEKNLVLEMVWALVANNQKAKVIIKNSGIANKLLEIANHVKVVNEANEMNLLVQVLNYVLKIICSDRKIRKS